MEKQYHLRRLKGLRFAGLLYFRKERAMEKMIYGDREAVEKRYKILFHDKIDGVECLITNVRGSHPCAYINVPKENWDVFIERDIKTPSDMQSVADIFKIWPHGGITFYDDKITYGLDIPGHWFGWDYGHYGDYMWQPIFTMPPMDEEHKWTTEEIYKEIKEVIEDMKKNYPAK